MSVPNQTPYIIYNANGLTTVFPFEFYIINSGDIQVTINGTVVTSGYSVTGVGNIGGGDVTFITPPTSGSVVMLERVVPTYRLTDYQDNGDLLADTVNKDFDRLWMAIQRSFIYLGLALRRPLLGGPFNAEGYRITGIADPVNDSDAVTKKYLNEVSLAKTLRTPENITSLPPVALRAGKLIGFDGYGNPIPVLPESGSAADVLLLLAAANGYTYIPSMEPYVRMQRWRDEGDVRGWGAKCNGMDDDTASISQAFSESQRIKLTGNPLVSGTILIRENQNIVSDGAVISTTSDTLSILYADNVDGWSITGNLVLERKGYTTAPTVRVETACGLAVQDCLNFHIDGVVSRGFAGSGFYFTASSPDSRGFVASSLVTNCIAHHNFSGFTTRPGFAAEYISFTGCISRYNYRYGVEDLSGNIQWTGGQVTHNVLTGFSVQNGYNDAHGNVAGTAINHNAAKSIEIVGTNNGFTFSGCSVFDNAANDGFSGAIYFDNCSGVVFSGCQIMADIVEVATSGRNLISNCMFANAPTRTYQHTVTSGGMNVLLRGCVRAGEDNLGIENAFGGSGIRFTRSANQSVTGSSGDIVFDSPSFAFGQIQYDTSAGSVNIFHAGQYVIDINVIVLTGSTGIYADVYKGSSIVGSLTATKRDGGTTHALCGRIVFGAGRGEKVKLNIRSDSAGFTVSSGSFMQVALID